MSGRNNILENSKTTQETGNAALGARFKEIREENGFDQGLFGVICGISQSGTSKIEAGESGISLKTADAIITLFHVSYEWLFHGELPKYKGGTSPISQFRAWKSASALVQDAILALGAQDRISEKAQDLLVMYSAQGVAAKLPSEDIRKRLAQLTEHLLAKSRSTKPE